MAVALLICFSTASAATHSDEELAAIRTELQSLLKRVSALEAENEALRTGPPRSDSSSDRADAVRFKGDFRYRFENIDAGTASDRDRNRIRARVSVITSLDDGLQVGIGLASGGDDPVSTNQTLGGGGATKDARLGLAFFKWHMSEQFTVVGGKFKSVWYRPEKHGLIWDGDYNPEGLAFTYGQGGFFANAALTWLESDSKKSNSRLAYGVQSGFDTDVGDASLRVGAGYFHAGVEGQAVYHGDPDDFFGNSYACVDITTLSGCTYSNDYREIEVFAHLKTQLDSRQLVLFADYVRNTDANRFDTGWAVGAKLGNTSSGWQLGYTYQDLEADAVLGLLTDSDFGGGGTDARGHILKGTVAIDRNWQIGITYFSNQRDGNHGAETDYNRLQLDTKLKF